MTILKFEVDTSEIFDDGYDKVTFENLIKEEFLEEIKKHVFEDGAKKQIKEVTAKIIMEVESQVETKLRDLINQEMIVTDNWGKTVFTGPVEDYIKNRIDEKFLSPVDKQGKYVTKNAPENSSTWIDWVIEREAESSLSKIKHEVHNTIKKFCGKSLEEGINDFTLKILLDEIVYHLKGGPK